MNYASLLELSEKIDKNELFPLVKEFMNASKSCENLSNVYDMLTLTKQKTKNVDILIFLSALLEAIALFNDFSSLDQEIKKEMIQSCKDSTQFYLNRLLKESKEKNDTNKQQWAKEFEAFVEQYQGGTGKLQSKSDSNSTPSKQLQNKQSNLTKNPKSSAISIKEPKMELVGNVWYVENQINEADIKINITEMQQRIVIINCTESIIQINGKCTAISVEQGNKLGIVVQDAIVSTFELLNSNKIQIQLNSTCPTMTIDNSEGIQVFLGFGVSDKFELLSCKSNEINLYRQTVANEDFSNEIPVPEQFKSYFDESGNLKTTAVRHTGV